MRREFSVLCLWLGRQPLQSPSHDARAANNTPAGHRGSNDRVGNGGHQTTNLGVRSSNLFGRASKYIPFNNLKTAKRDRILGHKSMSVWCPQKTIRVRRSAFGRWCVL